MSLTLMSNVVTAMLCVGVIVQSIRMMRRLRLVSDGQLGTMVNALDRATSQASTVLAGLRSTLSIDGAAVAQDVAAARELREELTVLIGIANSMADRLVEAGQAPKRTARRSRSARPFSEPEALDSAVLDRLADIVEDAA
ncbi:DUF6468 domain-containing protein [Sphingobium subterraneum]|uniref:DUF6468 domain-containing protein n=1 Tax=Sphingobium subterraneum TaxID=627688 RepID=A0A841IXA5_9SPHN|nr:DUF6468 domain-containing protein [Sphingobium subterraneum]MBB6122772.1 hypothetical protein [Sphingobium subterraneum]